MMRGLALALAMAVLGSTGLVAHASDAVAGQVFHVGYRVIDLPHPNDAQGQPLTVAVWYPSAASPAWHTYGGPTTGRVAVDGAALAQGEPFPMLVFSHGYGGSGLSAAFFTEALAARGWIVVCPDHRDRHSAVRVRGGQQQSFDRLALLRHASQIAATGVKDRAQFDYRLDEMQLAVDGMLRSPEFGGLIDLQRIALGGHSFGGFTALGLSGTIPERHDPRIKALLLFSTGTGGRLFTAHELARVRVPSMLFLGEREANQKRGDASMAQIADTIFQNVSPPKYFLELQGANHFSFNNRFVDTAMARQMSGTPEQFALINRYAIAFLEKHVTQKPDADRVLAQRDAQLVRYVTQGPGAPSPR